MVSLRECWASPFRPVLVASAILMGGCAPKIGAKCLVSSDCATNGSRVCDTSQPDGYCTIFNCTDDSCPNNAACVVIDPGVPGCSYNDYGIPSRSSRTLCLATCNSDSDCRQDNGYICASPLDAPWRAIILDNNQSEKVCIVAPTEGTEDAGLDPAPICMPSQVVSSADAASTDGETGTDGQPPLDAQFSFDAEIAEAQATTDAAESGPPVDAAPEAQSIEGEDAESDGGLETADGAPGAGIDAASNTSLDGGADATVDAAADAFAADAPGGD